MACGRRRGLPLGRPLGPSVIRLRTQRDSDAAGTALAQLAVNAALTLAVAVCSFLPTREKIGLRQISVSKLHLHRHTP